MKWYLKWKKGISWRFSSFSLPDNTPLRSSLVSESNVVELFREEAGEELGLRIVGGKDTPLGNIVIQEIVRDSQAARDGRLAPGDHILEVRACGDFFTVAARVFLGVKRLIFFFSGSTTGTQMLPCHLFKAQHGFCHFFSIQVSSSHFCSASWESPGAIVYKHCEKVYAWKASFHT